MITACSIILVGIIIYSFVTKINLVVCIKKLIEILLEVYKIISNIQRVRHIVAFFSLILGIILLVLFCVLKINLMYINFYANFILIILSLNILISNINDKDKISKPDFIRYITEYLFIVALYIILFGNLYYTTFNLGDGYFRLDGEQHPDSLISSYFISGMVFLSYDVGFFPEKYLKLFVFIQSFISQIIILGFLFIMFGKLLTGIEKNTRFKK